MGKLTALRVAKAFERGQLSDGEGLYLRVASKGSKSWILIWKRDGKRYERGLGSAKVVGLSDARIRAKALQKEIAERGVLPTKAQRRLGAAAAAARSRTFKACAQEFVAAHEASWRNSKHRDQWTNTLETYVAPFFGSMPVHEVDTSHILQALTPIWQTKPETASRVRGRIEQVLDYAKSRGLRDGENPARWRGHLSHSLPRKSKIARVQHHAALPFAKMPVFYAALEDRDGIAALALQFTILTAARSGEVRSATWREIDLERSAWIVPAERMKGGKEHRVPLTEESTALLDRLKPLGSNPDDYIFPGLRKRPLSDMSMTAVLRRMEHSDITTHGFRSSFRDWAGEETVFAREVIEAALAHRTGDKVELAYRRSDALEKRRVLMKAWSAFVVSGRGGSSPDPNEKL